MPGSLSNLLKFSQLVTAGPGLKLSLAWETKLTITLHFLSFGRNAAKILTSLQLCYQVVQNSKAILSCGDWVLSWASSLSIGLAKKLVWCEKFKRTFWPTQCLATTNQLCHLFLWLTSLGHKILINRSHVSLNVCNPEGKLEIPNTLNVSLT